ncbi:MAG: class I SAM-dependent methyltransferase [Acidiferrobacterales bacterium]
MTSDQAHELKAYYSRRAAEYEAIYQKPERQQDLVALKSMLRDLLRGHRVLEIACGTGYWTEVVATVAESILATDTSSEVLTIARTKNYPPGRVDFAVADAYELGGVNGAFTAGLAAFWWSHLPKQRIKAFLEGFHRGLGSGARVVLVDNRYVEGSSTPVAERDAAGNTYQIRRLRDGSQHRVLKNFPDLDELTGLLGSVAQDLMVSELDYYWCVSYYAAPA